MEKYEKLKLLGRGAHGSVYLCKRLFDNKSVVVKEIAVEMKSTDERHAALIEVKLLDQLDHPNIIGYDEYFFDQNNLCIVMEYAQGGTLAEFITGRRGALISEQQILRYFAQLCNALHYLHAKNIIHRDLKPQNILLDKTMALCKLSDFGISKILSTRNEASTVIGTMSYLSPEICENKPYNQKTDVWSLGCILYELMTLKRAFDTEVLGSLVMQITRGQIEPVDDRYSDPLKQLVSRMLTIDPVARPSIKQIRADPLIVKHLFDHIDIGAIRCPKPFKQTKTIKLRSSNRSRKQYLVNHCADGPLPAVAIKPSRSVCKVFAWGLEFDDVTQLPLPANKMVTQMACSSSFKLGLTKENELLRWQKTKDINSDSWTCTHLKLSTPVQITQVACSENFYALITDRGILMTCGGGLNGCLSFGMASDQPKIVDGLIRYEITKVACSPYHVIAATSDNELFGWGLLDDGRLGLPGKGVQSKPQKIPLPANLPIHSIHCTADASAIVTSEGDLYCTGINNFNKLALRTPANTDVKRVNIFTKANIGARKIDLRAKQPFSLGLNRSAFISDGRLYTCGGKSNHEYPGLESSATDLLPCKVQTKDLTSIQSVFCGDGYCLIRTEDNRLYSWGSQNDNRHGKSGDETEIDLINLDNLSYDSILAVSSSDSCTMVAVKS